LAVDKQALAVAQEQQGSTPSVLNRSAVIVDTNVVVAGLLTADETSPVARINADFRRRLLSCDVFQDFSAMTRSRPPQSGQMSFCSSRV
jgi:hypothetical protein